MNIFRRARDWVTLASVPTPAGLPNVRVVTVFPLALLGVLVVLTVLGYTGSSTGFVQTYLSSAADPDLVFGGPQPVRSDEWFVQTTWTISQVQQGLPVFNQSFPGGMDATVQHELPSTDWSVIFRPHLLGFLVLPLDNAMAIKWWLPGLALIAACYFFLVTIVPKRPIMAAAVSVAFFFSPFFQLWYLPVTLWPAAWSFLAMATCVWLLRSPSRGARIGLSALLGYVTVTMGMGIYVPFIIPAVLVALAVCIGAVFTARSSDRFVGVKARIGAVVPMLVAGGAAVAVLGIWLLTRLPSIERFLGTVYPGQRLGPTGDMGLQGTVALMAGAFTPGLSDTTGAPLGSNASEASTFIFVGLFLVVGLVWIAIADRRRRRRADWTLVAALAVGALMVAYLLIPGWDVIAHLLFLDRTTTARMPLGVGILAVVTIGLLAARQDSDDPLDRIVLPWWITWLATSLAVVVHGLVIVFVWQNGPALLTNDLRWVAIMALSVASVWLFTRAKLSWAAIALVLAAVASSIGVNPLYRGVYDTNDTEIGRTIDEVNQAEPGSWVGVGNNFLPSIILVQSGLSTFNGFQSAPPEPMWDWIDPTDRYETQWNRLASISWQSGVGDPVLTNPGADQIHATFDSCATFAQEHVVHVLAVEPLETQRCLTLTERLTEGPTEFWIYEVVKK